MQANSNFVKVEMGVALLFLFWKGKTPWDEVGEHSTIFKKLVILCYLNNLDLCSRRVSSGSDSKLSL